VQGANANEMASLIRSNCRKVICIGRNYAAHIDELKNLRPKRPFFFLKPPTSILIPNAGPVLRPKGVDLHYEVELGLVIGKTIRDLPSALDDNVWKGAIESYIVSIDMTARNVQDEAKSKGLPWDIAKGFDTFLPISEPISPDIIKDPHNVELWLTVNGRHRQHDNTKLMMFGIARQLTDISRVMTLEKGDIVLTGTPKGVGPVVPGDVMEAGLKVDGHDIKESRIKVDVKARYGLYDFAET